MSNSKKGISFRLTIKEDEDLKKVVDTLPYSKAEYVRLALVNDPNYEGVVYVYGVDMQGHNFTLPKDEAIKLDKLVKKSKLTRAEYIRYVVVNKVSEDIKNLKE